MKNVFKSGLIISFMILIIFFCGCTGNSTYTIQNSTFNVPNNFQEGNTTNYNDPASLTETTFKLDNMEVFGVDTYPNSIEYSKGIQDPIYTDQLQKRYTNNIGNTQVTVLEDANNNLNYFFVKSGKYYSIVSTGYQGSSNSSNQNKIKNAMNMVVETIK